MAVSQQGVNRVKAAKTHLIDKLEAQQAELLRLHVEEGGSVSPNASRKERVRLQEQIEAAEKSLAATEEKLQLDAAMLRMALELAGDVAEVYRQAPDSVKRGYNQAFFKKLLVRPEWDESNNRWSGCTIEAELTEPYAVLLADGLAEEVLAEAKALGRAFSNDEGGPEGPPSITDVSNFEALAEGMGFEPMSPLARATGFQGRPLSDPPAGTSDGPRDAICDGLMRNRWAAASRSVAGFCCANSDQGQLQGLKSGRTAFRRALSTRRCDRMTRTRST